jgi:hypothetical protein
MKTFYKIPLLAIILIGSINVSAQSLELNTEIQSEFIDITGIFGVQEPASVTQFNYQNKNFGLSLYHAFSLQEFGKSIQTIVTPSYSFKLDSLGKFSIKPKVEIANLETAGGGFVRPGIHFIYKNNKNSIFNVGTWAFIDFREEAKYPKRLNGLTFMTSYTYYKNLSKKWKFTSESRVLYVDIVNTLQLSGVFQNIRFEYKPLGLTVATNGVYTFYRSDHDNQFFYNFSLSKKL